MCVFACRVLRAVAGGCEMVEGDHYSDEELVLVAGE